MGCKISFFSFNLPSIDEKTGNLTLPVGSSKYFFDDKDLQYKRVELPVMVKIMRYLGTFAVTVILFIIYKHIFTSTFGSPKEAMLINHIENIKLELNMVDREMDNTLARLGELRLSEERRYRPVLDLEMMPDYLRQTAVGGIERYGDITGYLNSGLMISLRSKIDDIKRSANLQAESFVELTERTTEWRREMEYLPIISPVNVNFRLGDGYKFRERHPVHGNPQWHHGQDFACPVGTPVYATGAGTVIAAGWNSGGFGNYVVIDHGYGYRTTYGHLSAVKVSNGDHVKRAALIGLSGNTGISSGPHLHYQIDMFGRTQNPLYFFNNDLNEEEYMEMIRTLSIGVKYQDK